MLGKFDMTLCLSEVDSSKPYLDAFSIKSAKGFIKCGAGYVLSWRY